MSRDILQRCARGLIVVLALLADTHEAAAYLPDHLIGRDWHGELLGGPADQPEDERQMPSRHACRKDSAATDAVRAIPRRTSTLAPLAERVQRR